MLTRRTLLTALSGLMLQGANTTPPTQEALLSPQTSPGWAILADGSIAPQTVELTRTWKGPRCRSQLRNTGDRPVHVKSVVLFALPHAFPQNARFYGEGFQMLSQTGGTLFKPEALGGYTDVGHYKLPQPKGATTVYGLLLLEDDGGLILSAFTSCHRFSGRFDVYSDHLDAVLDTEGLELGPGESWDLEELLFQYGTGRVALLEGLAERICHNHPPLRFPSPPTGWCSWYCFGPGVTDQQVLDNLEVSARELPGLKYIQIDDGYQRAMGDWLETGAAFGGDIRGVLKRIKERGFVPAIWVAPFIAEANSHLFHEHPDWFIQDVQGAPLPSDKVTFGGWRNGPWYALDGTHPEVQRHLEQVFRTMHQEWGCTYFKLDANFWGAMHGGRFHDPKATRVEAYRRGMQAVLRGAGKSFILGCNHPIWPSFGLIHGSRSSNDISRDWNAFAHTARENLSRNWQNGKLWWNDPDCLLLTGDITDDEFRFHATAVFAAGGLVLSGDDLTKIAPDRLAMLRKLLPPTGAAAEFEDESLQVGFVHLKGRLA